MGRSRQTAETITRQISGLRTLQQQQLAREYAPSARRLSDGYNQALEGINRSIAGFAKNGKVAPLTESIKKNLDGMQPLITEESKLLQATGIRSGVNFGGIALAKGGLDTRGGNIEGFVGSKVDYVNSPEFKTAVNKLGTYHADNIANLISKQVALGKDPEASAAAIMGYFNASPALPKADIENLTRTLQNYAARRATSETYKRSGVKQWLWVANLGSACLSCSLLHNTIHDLSEEPICNDHHRGRCAMAPITPSWDDLLGISKGSPEYETGQSWFDNLSDAEKRKLLGVKLFEAYQRGDVVINTQTVVGVYNNPIFGEMRRRNTNGEIARLSQ